jgi:lipid II:glycine glycyltransferase (peptidoglycan interpeptide bridge formation enzyme)
VIRWKSLTDPEARTLWDENLARFSDCSPFQTYAWGEYRRSLGWEPWRWVAVNDQEQIVAMMQGSLRRRPFGVGFVWCEGGPVGDLSACDQSLQTAMQETAGIKRLYCRFRCDRARHIEDALRLTAQGWSLPWSPLTTCYSMVLDLSPDEDSLLSGCERNWRRNLKRSQEGNLTVRQWLDPNADEVLAVYSSMQNLKGLEEQLSREEIVQILRNVKQQMVLYRCDDERGDVASLLGCLVIGDRACAVFSATSEEGRKLNASYAVFWALFQHCRRIGVKSFDLAGIDPIRNHGVYRFKRATGAQPIEYLGEWDWGSSTALRWIGNCAVERRDTIKKFEGMLRLRRRKQESTSEAPDRSITATSFAANEGITQS